MFTANVNNSGTGANNNPAATLQLFRNRQTDLGQYIFCRSTVNEESKLLPAVRPSWLYRSLPTEK
jgi:hypothetical protein